MLFLFSTAAVTFIQAIALVFLQLQLLLLSPFPLVKQQQQVFSRVGSVSDSVICSFHLCLAKFELYNLYFI
jgi:hypothetical protein